jgi:hypothetical protein
MIDLPLLNDDYREAFLYLLDEIDRVRPCSDNKEPWFPKDEEKLEEALRVYGGGIQMKTRIPFLTFPGPNQVVFLKSRQPF